MAVKIKHLSLERSVALLTIMEDSQSHILGFKQAIDKNKEESIINRDIQEEFHKKLAFRHERNEKTILELEKHINKTIKDQLGMSITTGIDLGKIKQDYFDVANAYFEKAQKKQKEAESLKAKIEKDPSVLKKA